MLKKILSGVIAITMTVPAAESMALSASADAKADNTTTINAVATSHLDTNWSWDLERSINEYLPETFEENVDLMKDFPDYKFNFEGAYRYQLLKEYYPEKFEELKKYIDNGQWNVSGTALENGDVNVPSPEALFRNILYGNNYFLDNFGKTSKDIYLPDCFGFGYALPSVMAHSNLLGFSTQKLNWGNAFPNGQLPFDIGIWKGPDGKSAIADINLNGYWYAHAEGVRSDNEFLNRLARSPIGKITALFGACGDRGGGTAKLAVRNILAEQAANGANSVKVNMSTTDGLMKSLTEDDRSRLKTYDGEMVMQSHGVGSYTSKVMSKRWNRQAEQMAYAAELANVNSAYLKATEYPKKQLESYWTRVIAHQFHDDITGTSNETTYKRSYNDLMLAIKQFESEYQSGAAGVIRAMDTTSGDGEVALVVNNPVAADRTGTVTGTVTMPNTADAVSVTDSNGNAVSCQILSRDGNRYKIAFKAEVKSLGYKKYLVKCVSSNDTKSALKVTKNSLSNERYDVSINGEGDISSIFDKQLGRELLKEPVRFGIFENTSTYWAAWELNMVDYAVKKPKAYVGGTPEVTITENGPARAALKIKRKYNDSTFVQTISLEDGGKMVKVDNTVDWHEKASFVKAIFTLNPTNPNATYDLGLGTITRQNNTLFKAEVPVQKWADLTDSDGSYGVSIINDCKYGMDKFDNNTLRLTLIHTPLENYTHHSGFYPSSGQNMQDFGENRFAFAIYGHEGNYAQSEVQRLAEEFNQPMCAYQADPHSGALGSDYSFGGLNNDKVLLRCVKKAEKSDEIIVRVNEGSGIAQTGVELSLGDGIASARELYATEENIGPATVSGGKLRFDIGRYGVKTFALTLNDPNNSSEKLNSQPLALDYNADVYSSNENRNDCDMTYVKDSYPSELVPESLLFGGVNYLLGSCDDGKSNAVRASGQTISLPAGYNTLNILAASLNGDKEITVGVNGADKKLTVGDFSENVAQWDCASLMHSGYIKEQSPAFVATHRHTAGEDNIANTTYMFSYSIDVDGAGSVTLPDDRDIILFAATLTNDKGKKAESVSEISDRRARTGSGKPSDIARTITFDSDDKGVLTENNFEEKSVSNTSCVFSTEQAASGDTSLKLSGSDDSASGGFTYYTILTKPIKVRSDTVLTYKFYPANELGRYSTIDMAFDSGMPLRDRPEAVDQNGVQMHPSSGRGKVGEWTEVTCRLGDVAAGQTITRLMFAYDHVGDTGSFASYVDDLRISSPSDTLDELIKKCSAVSNDGSVYSAKSFGELTNALSYAKSAAADKNASEYEITAVKELLSERYENLIRLTDGLETIPGYSYDVCSGRVTREYDGKGNLYTLGSIFDTSYIAYKGLDFKESGADVLRVNYSGNATTDARIIVYKGDSPAGKAIGTIELPATGDWGKYTYAAIRLKEKLVGEQDICIVFRSMSDNTCNLKALDFSLGKAQQPEMTISGGNIKKTYGDADFKLSLSGGLGSGELSFECSDPSVAKVDNTGKVTLLKDGTTEIKAVKQADDLYNGAESSAVSLTVSKLDILSATVGAVADQTYTGAQIQPKLEVKTKSKKLSEDIDYTVSYSDNTKIGVAFVKITGVGGCTGSKTVSFNIKPIDIAGFKASVEPYAVYSGKQLTPAVTLKNGDTVLKAGEDYTAAYLNNVNAGTASVKITGKGVYSGTQTLSFTIVPLAASNISVSVSGQKQYTGKPVTPKLTVKSGTKTLVSGVDFTVSCKNNIKPGKATVTVTGTGNYSFTKQAAFAISPKRVSGLKLKGGKKSAVVSFKKAVGARGYKIIYSLKKSFKNAKTKSVKKVKNVITKLMPNKKYYVKVSAFTSVGGKKIFGAACKPKTVKVK